MPQWILTSAIAFFLVFIAILALGIGWLFTGKPKIRGGMCGRDPTRPKDSCDTDKQRCSICEHDNPKKKP